MQVNILGIESSCDDTAAAVIQDGILLSDVIADQEVHKKFGGVVPELASRAHQQNIIPVVDRALKEANIDMEAISAVAFTMGPGLLGSLLVGTSFAKGFALARNIPLVDVNHLQAHILAHFIRRSSGEKTTSIILMVPVGMVILKALIPNFSSCGSKKFTRLNTSNGLQSSDLPQEMRCLPMVTSA